MDARFQRHATMKTTSGVSMTMKTTSKVSMTKSIGRLPHLFLCTVLGLFFFASTPKSFADFIPLKIATGAYNTCVLSTDGAVKCWGENGEGQLGTGDTKSLGLYPDTMGDHLPNVDLGLPGGDRVTDICAGMRSSCVATHQGKVKCWGSNYAGQLGHGSQKQNVYSMGTALPFTELGANFRVKNISCGYAHVCARSDEGTVKCWGMNAGGALGLGLSEKKKLGSSPADMGANLPTLNGLTGIQQLSSGQYHNCVLGSQGVRCWGDGGDGQTGLESNLETGTTPDTVPGKLPYLKLNLTADEKVLSIDAGESHTCAVVAKNSRLNAQSTFVKCWGNNSQGALGTGDRKSYGQVQNTMGSFLPTLNLAMNDAVSVTVHNGFTCALAKTGKVKCWGMNQFGNLGLGDTNNHGAVPTDMGSNLFNVDLGLPVKSLSIGPMSQHACAILVNSEIKCWGSGFAGQLGYESGDNIGTELNQMGDALPFVKFR